MRKRCDRAASGCSLWVGRRVSDAFALCEGIPPESRLARLARRWRLFAIEAFFFGPLMLCAGVAALCPSMIAECCVFAYGLAGNGCYAGPFAENVCNGKWLAGIEPHPAWRGTNEQVNNRALAICRLRQFSNCVRSAFLPAEIACKEIEPAGLAHGEDVFFAGNPLGEGSACRNRGRCGPRLL